MASRKEQKEQLRREREEREAAERAQKRRKQLVGYGVGGVVALVLIVVVAVVLVGGGDGKSTSSASTAVLPDGGSVPKQKVRDLDRAAKAAGCTLKSYKGKSREHTDDVNKTIKYDSDPPTEGAHYVEPAADGSYDTAPKVTSTVHALEHGRIVIWFKKSLPKQDRANLKALFDEDSYQLLLVPHDAMKYQVAASAWSREPVPNGTGRLLGCDRFDDGVYDAIRTFKDEHRGNGPEPIP
ncbi:MAG: DUF3105 domain-containing protein [Thermoleophilaceae bacterium]